MNCKVCLEEIDDDFYCEVCGDTGLCEGCAEDCAELDEAGEPTNEMEMNL